ncbi:uncharacterized protein LOC112091691 [Morus notabilis]|uniref:uncharacterized protein LOC112091691 n=1 Tax=Morus notabilis TaxID=981085 RepID=UPI000CED2E1C|nr:uncharacterized protein LOC112091691 [Morus notabilis]
MGVPEKYWVEFAVYKFEGQASTWWKQTMRLHDVSTMTWELFEELFNERYFPQSYRDKKAMEFMGLEQGDMTVKEYKAKFNDLSRFAPTLVEYEQMKCHKFEKGLKSNVQKSLVALRIRVYRYLVASAISVEQDNLAYPQTREAMNRASGGPQRNQRRNRNREQASGEATSGSSGSSGSGGSGSQ